MLVKPPAKGLKPMGAVRFGAKNTAKPAREEASGPWLNRAQQRTAGKSGKTSTVHGVPSSFMGSAQLDRQPLRVFERFGNALRQVALGRVAVAPPLAPRSFRSVSDAAVTRSLTKALAERARELAQGIRIPRSPALPEDTSLQVTAFHMARLGPDNTQGRFVEQMARIGQHEGFSVVLRVDESQVKQTQKSMKAAGLDNVQVVGMKAAVDDPVVGLRAAGDQWSEDAAAINRALGFSVPALFEGKKGAPSFSNSVAIYEDRLRRLYPHANVKVPEATWTDAVALQGIKKKFPDVTALPMVGAVGERGSQRAMAVLAEATGAPLSVDISHVEGGNKITGILPSGQTYALVGKDSVATTRGLLARDLGRKVSEREALEAIAADFGIEAKNLHPVEQPGEFHLDMAMAAFAPGQVVLNDARQAFTMQARWLREDHAQAKPKALPAGADTKARARYQRKLKEWNEEGAQLEQRLSAMEERSEMAARFEARAAADLRAAGMEVHRMAGAFLDPRQPDRHSMNFFNGEAGTNAKGERFFITNGGDARAEKHAVESLLSVVPTGLTRIHFLDRELSRLSLQGVGGINCRVRAEGVVVKNATAYSAQT